MVEEPQTINRNTNPMKNQLERTNTQNTILCFIPLTHYIKNHKSSIILFTTNKQYPNIPEESINLKQSKTKSSTLTYLGNRNIHKHDETQ